MPSKGGGQQRAIAKKKAPKTAAGVKKATATAKKKQVAADKKQAQKNLDKRYGIPAVAKKPTPKKPSSDWEKGMSVRDWVRGQDFYKGKK